jgi:hypothetical protein
MSKHLFKPSLLHLSQLITQLLNADTITLDGKRIKLNDDDFSAIDIFLDVAFSPIDLHGVDDAMEQLNTDPKNHNSFRGDE